MYKYPSVKTLISTKERALIEYEAFLNYKEPTEQTENLLNIGMIVGFVDLFNELKRVLDQRIQDYFYLRGIRSNLDFAQDYIIKDIDHDEIIVSYRTYTTGSEKTYNDITIPITILNDPNYLNEMYSASKERILEDLKVNAGVKEDDKK